MIKIHFFNPPTKYGHMVSYSYGKFIESFSEIKSVKEVGILDADYIICMFNPWSKYSDIFELETDSKIIMHSFDCRTSYHGKILTAGLSKASAIWCGGNNLTGFKKFSAIPFFLPVGTWKEAKSNKKKCASITMSGYSDKKNLHRKQIVQDVIRQNKNNNFELHSGNKTYWGIEDRKNVTVNKILGIESFQKYEFNLEAYSGAQLRIGLENYHWSDRQALATSNFCHVITDYKPTLENWDSAIPIDEAIEYDIRALEGDIKKWNWKKLIENLLKETIQEI